MNSRRVGSTFAHGAAGITFADPLHVSYIEQRSCATWNTLIGCDLVYTFVRCWRTRCSAYFLNRSYVLMTSALRCLCLLVSSVPTASLHSERTFSGESVWAAAAIGAATAAGVLAAGVSGGSVVAETALPVSAHTPHTPLSQRNPQWWPSPVYSHTNVSPLRRKLHSAEHV